MKDKIKIQKVAGKTVKIHFKRKKDGNLILTDIFPYKYCVGKKCFRSGHEVVEYIRKNTRRKKNTT